MNFKYYLSNGTVIDYFPNNYNNFFIQEDCENNFLTSRYVYKGDSILYELDSACAKLYSSFQCKVFTSDEEYYKHIDLQPQGITRAGLDSDVSLTKDLFERYFTEDLINIYTREGIEPDKRFCVVMNEINNKKFKLAYLADCQSLINTLQELILGSNSCFIGFYKLLSSVPAEVKISDHYYSISSDGRLAYNMLYSLIIQIYSTFDILTKIAYEFENLQDCTNDYKKLASSKVMFKQKKHLTKIDKMGTVFEKDKIISIFANLRNELIHNATWEMNPKIFFSIENGTIIERYIYLPDINEEGHLVSFKNRKRFFAEGKKVNEELPVLFLGVLKKIYNTVLELNNKFG